MHDLAASRKAMYGPIPAGGFFSWRTMAGYLDRLEKAQPAINVAALVPNGQLRMKHLSDPQRAAGGDELRRMVRDLEESLDDGAFGFSTGLEYVQERSAPSDEIETLCRSVAATGKLYATHTRDRDSLALKAIQEAINAAARTGVRLQVSHITPRGGMHDTEEALKLIDAARQRGLDVGFDMHTRLFGFTHLKQLLPLWAMEGTASDLRQRLMDNETRDRIRLHSNIISKVADWRKIVLIDSAARADLNGLDFTEISDRLGMSEFDAALTILSEEAENLERPMVLLRTYSEEQLQLTYQHQDCMVGSDATSLAPDGPLAGEKFYGSYTWAAWFLRRMVREKKALTLHEAIRRLTSLPAATIGLQDRGLVKRGYKADVVILDFPNYSETGTVETPSSLAVGVRHLFVNGVSTIRDGELTGSRAGRVLRC